MSDDYLEYIIDLLADWRPVRVRRMFGGAGLYVAETMFGLVANDVIYLRVDEGSRAAFENAGASPFRPFRDRKPMPYYEVPADVLEDRARLHSWAARALAADRTPGPR